MPKPEPKLDFPWDEVIENAKLVLKAPGCQVFQKWTCDHCGTRQGMKEPNTFHETGTCEECSQVTNIRKRGHNFMLCMQLS